MHVALRLCTRGSWLAALASCALLSPPAAAAESSSGPILAVFNIDVRDTRIKPRAADRLTEYLTTQLAATGRYRVVPRGKIKHRLARQKRRSYRDCYARTCQIELGKELAAQKSLSCRLMRIGRFCVLTANLYDLRSSTSERAATARGGCGEDEVLGLIDRVVQRLGPGDSKTTARKSSAWPQLIGPAPPRANRAQIQRVINGAMKQVQRCYERELTRRPGVAGKVVVDIFIAGSGKVTQAAVHSSTVGSRPMERCILGVVRWLRFAPTPDGKPLQVRYPFVFRVADGSPSPAPTTRSPFWRTPPRPHGKRSRATSLTRSQVQAGMRSVKGGVQACYDRYRVPGTAVVRTTIHGDGAVHAARVTGVFAGTPTGRCVAAVVRRARFATFSGPPLDISYPFVLR